MKFVSTRGGAQPLSFEDVVLSGLADDEGLYVPQTIPQVSLETLHSWTNLSFTELSLEIMSLYIDENEISRKDLKEIIDKSFSTFTHKDITPVQRVGGVHILELFHGPTFSFKDVALQFLGNLFEYILAKRNTTITVVGATSGDTGSAAIYGLKGKKNVDVFILFPKDRVSKIQELQMTAVLDENVHCLRLDNGTFDDCQSIVKTLFGDLTFKKEHRLGAINSINWSRIMSQTVYYFYAYLQLKRSLANEQKDEDVLKVSFSVPTGNFGDIVAGYFAKRMGLPISRLVVATNANDILTRFFTKGEYHQADKVVPTCTPSMDIQVASNFERYLYYLSGESSSQVVQWMSEFKATRKLTVDKELLQRAQNDFISCSASHDEVENTIREYYNDYKYILDPHTAVGVCAVAKIVANEQEGATKNALCKQPVVCLSTAHPAKFSETVGKCVDVDVVQIFGPTRALLQGVKTKCTDLKCSEEEVRRVVKQNVKSQA